MADEATHSGGPTRRNHVTYSAASTAGGATAGCSVLLGGDGQQGMPTIDEGFSGTTSPLWTAASASVPEDEQLTDRQPFADGVNGAI